MTRLGRVRRALAALVTLLVLVVGLPAALMTWGMSPWRGELSMDAARAMFHEPGSDRVIAGMLTIAAWCVWALFLRALVVEALDARRDWAASRGAAPSRPAPLRMLARGLVVWLTMTAGSAASAGASSTPALATLLAPPASAALARDAPAAAPSTEPATPPATPVGESERLVVVPDPAGAWDLAERYLGDGIRWQELWERNSDRPQPDGGFWSDPEAVVPAGWQLVVPAAAPAAMPRAEATPAAPQSEVTVAPGDNFWQLAERTLATAWGRPPTEDEVRGYWHTLVDTNRDRLVPPPGDPDLIHPDQAFVAPPPGPDPTAYVAPQPSPPPTGTTATPAPGPDTTPTAGPEAGRDMSPGEGPVAEAGEGSQETELEEPSDESGPASPPAPEREPGTDVAGHDTAGRSSTGDRSGRRPGGVPAPPETDGTPPSPPTTTTTASTTTPPTATAPTEVSPPADVDTEDAEPSADVPVAPVLGAAGTVLAVALQRFLCRRRTRRSARLPVAVIPPPPPRSARAVADELLAADEDHVDRLDAALGHLCAGLNPRGGETCVQPKLVQANHDRIEVLLDRADPDPPRPWRPEASGRIWVLDAAVTAELNVHEAATPLPALVTIGTGDADVMIDLEAFGVVSLAGDPDSCWAMARSMVAELAARAEGTIGIDVVGVLEERLGEFDGVRVLASWDDVDTGVIDGSVRMLDAGRWPHTFAARASGRVFDGWAPAVWVTPACDNPGFRAAVEQVGTRPGAGSAIVVVAEDTHATVGRGIRILLDADGSFHVPELGMSGRAQLLAQASATQALDLLDDADHTAVAQTFDFPPPEPHIVPADRDRLDVDDNSEVTVTIDWTPDANLDLPLDPAPSPAAATIAPPASGTEDRYEDSTWEVLVRVCGEIHVEGGKDTLPPRESSVATFVALHGQADVDQVRDAVWGGGEVTRKRVQNVVSNMRRALGDAIHYTSEGRLKANRDRLITDLELIRRRLAYARHQTDPRQRADTLRGALEWVTGKVCTYPSTARRSWTWIDLDNWIPTVESTVGTVAHDLAALCLELDEPEGAVWAAQRGIEATGPREQLTVLLVRGYEMAGDAPAAAAALRSYERQMDELGGVEHSESLLELLDRFLPPDRAAS
jgi:hypothetical protein